MGRNLPRAFLITSLNLCVTGSTYMEQQGDCLLVFARPALQQQPRCLLCRWLILNWQACPVLFDRLDTDLATPPASTPAQPQAHMVLQPEPLAVFFVLFSRSRPTPGLLCYGGSGRAPGVVLWHLGQAHAAQDGAEPSSVALSVPVLRSSVA